MQPSYSIEPYAHDHDASLADMWNESDDQWPGTFTKGVPLTAERVGRWMDDEDCILRMVVLDPTGKVVGFGNLREEPQREGETCYVPLLNIHPEHQGRSLCRRMLTEMVDYATEHGYARMTIGTWPANLKSVPLYKKVGFHWRPGTNVMMENYLPTLRRLPVAEAFFANADWYRDFQRELEQVEDEQRHPTTGETPVFVYRWQLNGSYVEAAVDRAAQGLTALETESFAASAVAEEVRPAQGLPYTVRWEVENKQDVPLALRLHAHAEAGITLHDADEVLDGNQTWTIPPKQKQHLETSFVCDTDAPAIKRDQFQPLPVPRIHSTLYLNDKPLPLVTGVQYRQAVVPTLHPAVPVLHPGRPEEILLQLENQLDTPLRGTVTLQVEGPLAVTPEELRFEVDRHGLAGLPIAVTGERSGGANLLVTLHFKTEKQEVTIRQEPLAVLVQGVGEVASVRRKDELHVANDFQRVLAVALGGRFKIWDWAGGDIPLWFREEMGPPFTPHDCEKQDYTIDVQSEAGRVAATLRVNSDRFQGIALTRRVRFGASPVVQIRQRLENKGARSHTLKVLTRVSLMDIEFQVGQVTVPRRERLVQSDSAQFPMRDGDFPREPAGMAEQWLAYTFGGRTHGIVWPASTSEHKVEWGYADLHSAEVTLEPGQSIDLDPVYIYSGPGQWQDVRRLWEQVNGAAKRQTLQTGPPAQISLAPNPQVTLGNTLLLRLNVDNVRKAALNGEIVLEAPPGWTVKPNRVPVNELTQAEPLTAEVLLSTDGKVIGPATGQVRLRHELTDIAQPFTLIRLGDAEERVRTHQANPEGLQLLENGRSTWAIAADFHGGLVAWHEAGQPTNHLLCPYPEVGMLEWMNPWYGGLRPLLRTHIQDDEAWPGKLHETTFSPAPTSRTDRQGFVWHGWQLTGTPAADKFRGLDLALNYLTLPGSNVLQVRFTVHNRSSVFRKAAPGFMLFAQPDGAMEHSELHGKTLQRRRTATDNWTRVERWGAILNPESGRALVAVAASGTRELMLMDWGRFGAHLHMEETFEIPPRASRSFVAFLALTNSLAEASQYQVLANGGNENDS